MKPLKNTMNSAFFHKTNKQRIMFSKKKSHTMEKKLFKEYSFGGIATVSTKK